MCSNDPSRRDPSWRAVRLRVAPEVADELAGWLARDALGVEIVEHGSEALVSVYVGSDRDAAAIEARIDEGLERVWGIDPRRARPRRCDVPDERWVERYRSSLRPLPLGRRFLVVPRGEAPPETKRTALFVTPGRAFGTGEHPTTRLCVAALEIVVRPGSRWLDVGTGSGILALVAARCGAAHVEAVDVDPEAVEVAREVVARNGLEARIRVSTTPADALDAATFDGIVANISSGFFLDHAGVLAALGRPGAVLVASGFLIDDRREIASALAGHGFVEEERADEAEWASLVAVRHGAVT